MLKEFRDFIARGNAIDLAVGLVMGIAFGAIVNGLVNDIIMPPIGLIMGGINFNDLFIALNKQHYPSLKVAIDAGAPVIAYGKWISTLINFIIIALSMFILVKLISHLKRKPAPTAPELSAQEKLLGEIRDLVRDMRDNNSHK